MHEVYENTVRFAETDAQGIVFYGEYVTYQDETFAAFMEAVGFPHEALRKEAWDVHVVNVELDYRSSAVFRDRLANGMRVEAINRSSLEFAYRCRHVAEDRLVVEGAVTHVAVDDAGEPTRVPDEFRRAVRDFQDEPPTTTT